MKFTDQKTIIAVLLFLDQGHTVDEAVKKFGVTVRNIYSWLGTYKKIDRPIKYKHLPKGHHYDWNEIKRAFNAK